MYTQYTQIEMSVNGEFAIIVAMEALANIVVVLHLAYFVFVVGGFACILIGASRQWPWVYNPAFRIVHLLAVIVVPAEDVFRFSCPLNTLEGSLRSQSDSAGTLSGVSGILDFLLRHTIPGWVLDGMYWALAAVLVVLLFVVRPRVSAGTAE